MEDRDVVTARACVGDHGAAEEDGAAEDQEPHRARPARPRPGSGRRRPATACARWRRPRSSSRRRARPRSRPRSSAPGRRPRSARYCRSCVERSETRVIRTCEPASQAASGRAGMSIIEPSRAGIGSPCGSCDGWPSFAAIRSSSPSEMWCSSRSASACTSSHGTPSCSTRNSSSSRWCRSTSSATAWPRGVSTDAVVRLVLDQPQGVELLDHPGHRRRRDVQAIRERLGGDRAVAGRADLVDRLEVVLHRGGDLRHCHEG